jgi:hypothetical protein
VIEFAGNLRIAERRDNGITNGGEVNPPHLAYLRAEAAVTVGAKTTAVRTTSSTAVIPVVNENSVKLHYPHPQ